MLEHEELVILDFDHTLFNTTEFTALMAKRFEEKFGIAGDVFMAKREAVKSCCVVEDVNTFVNLLPNDDKKGMREEMHAVLREHAAEFLFDDAIPFLEKHLKTFDVVIVTHGDRELQSHKIRYSGIPKDVSMEIVQSEKGDVVEKYAHSYKRVHFIDDKAENIDSVKGKHPDIVAYFMKRPEDRPYGDTEVTCTCEHTEVEGLNFEIEPMG